METLVTKYSLQILVFVVILGGGRAPADGLDPPAGSILDATARQAEWFKTHCVSLSDQFIPKVKRICAVNSFDSIGLVGGKTLYFALYRRLVVLSRGGADGALKHAQSDSLFDKAPYNNTAVVIFEAMPASGKIRPILAEINEGDLGNEWFLEPRVLEGLGKQLVVIARGVYRGRVEENFYEFKGGAWARASPPG